MKKELYKIPGKVVGHHDPSINAIIDTWQSLFISLEEYKSTIYEIGIVDYAPKNGVTTWIIDTGHGRSVFRPEVQEFREEIARPKLEEVGIKYLFVVLPEKGIGKFSAGKTANIYGGQEKMKTFEVSSMAEVRSILMETNGI